MTNELLRLGIYRHYKGKLYEVIALVRHSETLEELILYKALYPTEFGRDSLWVRPKEMFYGEVEMEGRKVPRFEFLKEQKNN